ncbi:unnamed protein product [Symbiodinium sp. CCMP2456]|nr:unnamed protein product [Symbiodinium sp. CCMP2456]
MAAVSVYNDLQAPLEVKLQSGGWQVVYPNMSCDVERSGEASDSLVEVRLRESQEVKGGCHAGGGSSLRASVDFGAFSQQCKGRDRAEARELAREGKRRKEAQERTEAMIQEATARRRNKEGLKGLLSMGIRFGLPSVLLVVCSGISPESAVAAALLASATVPLCCCISLFSMFGFLDKETSQFFFGEYESVFRVGVRLLGLLVLSSFAAMTARHILQGYWWSAFIVWPGAVCSGSMWLCAASIDVESFVENTKERDRKSAEAEVSNRTIRFEGSVIRERGRPCVASWPGKYEGAWETLVSQGRNGQVSAAVVFLPQGTDDYGKCDSIPLAEGLPGTCWCTPLYGEQKPWGCRWFTKWRENIETAVASEAELEVYYFQNQVGQGKVKSFETAGDDNLQREESNKKQKEFEESPEFKQALDAGLGNLSNEPRGDGSSQYSREARRLFLASLSETERQFLAASEGLGNSQKAEVAWLEKKGYEYWEVDVSTWLPGEGVERCVPASAKQQPPLCSRQDDFSPVSVSIAQE